MKLNLLPNAGTEIHQPVTENQVVKMITSFFRNASRSLKIRLPRWYAPRQEDKETNQKISQAAFK